MNPTDGPLLPMKIGKVDSTPFEEVSAVKIVEGFVLVMQTVTVSRKVFNNDQWLRLRMIGLLSRQNPVRT